ncbi:hypothetical protein BCR33DRAFT_714331 [Rhizoclosmatium globosum]|uniref:Uncharacterized protein n=1 Tax=Rhizoclosmatium globosum TaxID=329046 RepID=A0A1Y2CNG3_9FUNG|nr:hypothetical protein BCR33DRAFT_714331 [Rhizoclosmatium globosum]|eukprot:ORY48578.1 hypothetical protein BCR33DRAFT_714331 [Rhizoclosmatium globosum]
MSISRCADVLEGMALLSMLQLFFLVMFIATIETDQKGFTAVWKSVSKPVNVAILVGNMGLIGLFLVSADILRHQGTIFSENGLWALAAYAFLSVTELAYLCYSWFRSESIIAIIFPAFSCIFESCVQFSPVVVLSQIIPFILSYKQIISNETCTVISAILTGVCGCYVIVFDSIMIYSFIKFLQTTRHLEEKLKPKGSRGISNSNSSTNPEEANVFNKISITNNHSRHEPQFRIIAQYGIFANCFCILILITYGLAGVFSARSVGEIALATVSLCLLEVVFSILFGMKVALHNQSVRYIKDSESQLERALGKDQLKSIRQSHYDISAGQLGSVSSDDLSNFNKVSAMSGTALPMAKASTRSMGNLEIIGRQQSMLSLSNYPSQADSTLVSTSGVESGYSQSQNQATSVTVTTVVRPKPRNLKKIDRPRTMGL